MRANLIRVVYSLAWLVAARSATANDGAASLAAGGIQFETLAGVAMETEDLEVSPSKVRVVYTFVNRTGSDITTHVAFPVPEFDEAPPFDIELDLESENPMHFSILVDGQEIGFKTEKTLSDGRVSVVHHWQQTFPAKSSIRIEHQYRPVIGAFWLYHGDGAEFTSLLKEYCVSESVTKLISLGEHLGKDLHYILTTASTWEGPIRKFRLTIRNEPEDKREQFVSTCFPGITTDPTGALIAEHSDYRPASDLKVLFIDCYPETIKLDRPEPPSNEGSGPGERVEWKGIPLLPSRLGDDIEKERTFVYTVAQEPAAIEEFYRERLSELEWKFEGRRAMEKTIFGGPGVMLSFTRDEASVVVTTIHDSDKGETNIVLTMLVKEPR